MNGKAKKYSEVRGINKKRIFYEKLWKKSITIAICARLWTLIAIDGFHKYDKMKIQKMCDGLQKAITLYRFGREYHLPVDA